MKRLLNVAAFIAVLFASAITVQAATILFPSGGGTGNGTNPTYGQVLVGNAGGTYTLTATSSLGITSGGGSSVYPFTLTGNATSTKTQFNGGLTAFASSTIGDMTSTGGLTVSGNATTTGSAYFGGNLGIGIQAPGTPLDVLGNIRSSSSLTDSTNKAFRFLDRNYINAQNDFLLVFGQSKSTGNTLIFGGGQAGNTAASSIAFFTGAGNNTDTGTSRMTIDASGNVGVGTSTAGTLLSIGGNGTGVNFVDNGTTTFSGKGINLQNGGCFAIAGVCLSSGGGTTASTTLLGDNNTFSGTDTFSNSIIGSITGNAGTATKLFTARNINGVAFDGTGAITIQAASSTALGDNNTWSGSNAFSSLITGSISGNAATATKLATARAINGVNFDGTAAITLFAASSTALGDNNIWSGTAKFNNAPTLASLNGLIAGNSGQTYAISTSTPVNFSITGNSGTATALAANGTNCSAGNYPLGVDASGNSEGCTAASTGTVTSVTGTYPILSTGGTTPVISTAFGTTTTWGIGNNGFVVTGLSGIPFVAASSTLNLPNTALANSTISGISLGGTLNSLSTNSSLSGTAYNGSASVSNWGLNLGNSNIWTVLQQFGNASSTQLSVPNQAWFGSTATSTFNSAGSLGIASTSPAFPLSVNNAGSDFYITTTGKVIGRDTTNAWSGRISPTHSFALTTGTTTTWTASTTATAYSPFIVMPFSGTIKQVYCLTDSSFLGVNVQVNGSNATPSYFVASTTSGNVALTAGNTFTKGQKVLMNVGTTTTATTQSLSCTFDATETI